MKLTLTAAALLLAATGTVVHAHGDAPHGKKQADATAAAEQMPFGRAGDPKAVGRTIDVTMNDAMRFSPATFTVKRGETVRFVVRNDGKLFHEMVLGTDAELAKHAELMKRFPDMEHDDAHMIHVKPGSSEALVWTFNRPGVFRFACLVPGHYEAGMTGTITVR